MALTKISMGFLAICCLVLLAMALASPAGKMMQSSLNQVVMTTANSHAINHPEADLVRSCQPDFRIYVRPEKYVDVCQIPGGWGFRPWLKTGDARGEGALWSERTAYQKPTIDSLEDLIDYVKRNNSNPFLKAWRLFQRSGDGWVEVMVNE